MEEWIATLLWDSQAALKEERDVGINDSASQSVEIYRMKGVLDVRGEAKRLVVSKTDYHTFLNLTLSILFVHLPLFTH